MNAVMKYEFAGTPGPWHAVQYANYWELHTELFYGEKSLLNHEECLNAGANATLAAASTLLLSALINIFDFPQEYLQKWRTESNYINISITPQKLNDALSAIEAALNLKTVEK